MKESSEIPKGDYMSEVLSDVNDDSIREWTSANSLKSKESREFEGYKITESIDGAKKYNREISFIEVTGPTNLPPHVHKNSDAYFIFIKGAGTLIIGDEEISVSEGDKIEVPKNTKHGFIMRDDENLAFVSVQSPPIRNHETGEEDFEVVE
ncbi:cupin domain-containing protein [Candidatus Nomurabacteria bacterium]|nr:cupin domain-containing protein [Candidatus Nomurabacteria bacterium]